MAKNVELKPLNKVTWNLKTVPDDVNILLDKIKSVHLKQKTEEYENGEILNNTGLKEITAYLSLKDNIIDTFVVTPSGILYQFTVDINSENFDLEWWTFAFKNYQLFVSTSEVKKKLAELSSLELKDISAKTVSKGKEANESMSLRELFATAYP